MEFSVKIGNLEKNNDYDIIAIGLFENRKLSSILEKLDNISEGFISTILQQEKMDGTIGKTLLLHYVPNLLYIKRILIIGCGKERTLDERQYKKIVHTTIDTLKETHFIEAKICFMTELHVIGRSTYWKVRQFIAITETILYTFDRFKSHINPLHQCIFKIVFNVQTHRELTIGARAIQHAVSIATGIKTAKDLGNMPPNICNSRYLSVQAIHLAEKNILTTTVQVIDEKQMEEIGMHAYLAVGRGSSNESIMSVIEYKGSLDTEKKPIVLIGKGLTFDAGGISIKSSENMQDMKYDMCGAAAVYGVLQVATELKLPLNIVGIIAGCENLLDGCSFRPGDIVTTLSGKTVEILNTDAEGRLVLCDVLTYAERFNPEVVIDVATLTGACVIALGHYFTGLMSNHDPLAHELIKASEETGDHSYRLPLVEEFKAQLDSTIADLVNVGGRSGGAITAGCFLSSFAYKYNWAHLDIAGTAWCKKNSATEATGRPVAMLSQFLLNRSGISYEEEE